MPTISDLVDAYSLLGSTGELIISEDCYNYDYITNPIRLGREDNYLDFLFKWNDRQAADYSNLVRWYNNVQSEEWSHVFGYSYGWKIKTQDNPVVYDAANSFQFVGSYNSCHYI